MKKMQPKDSQTTNAWQQMLAAQAEIRGYQGGDEHACNEHGHVFEHGQCVSCGEIEDAE
jgi:hypothetical protein